MSEIYVSTDIEADGPIPGPHSMLSLGSAAYQPDKTLVATFSVNLETLPDAEPHPRQTEWWKKHKKAFEAARVDPVPPDVAMRDYVAWLDGLPGEPVFVAWPLGFDFTFVYWYLERFVGRSPFGFSGIDVKSVAMAMLGGRDYRQTVKRHMPRRWFDEHPTTHVALDDAIAQGALFCNMLAELHGASAADES